MTTQELKEVRTQIGLRNSPPLPPARTFHKTDELIAKLNDGRVELILEQNLLQGLVFKLRSTDCEEGIELICEDIKAVQKVSDALAIDIFGEIRFPDGTEFHIENNKSAQYLFLVISDEDLVEILASLDIKVDVFTYLDKFMDMKAELKRYSHVIAILLGDHIMRSSE